MFLAGGTVNGSGGGHPAALVLDTGAVDATWQPPVFAKRSPDPSGTPYVPTFTALATDGQRLYVSGDFERVAGSDRDGVAALATTTGGLDPWDPAPLVVQPLEFTTGGLLTTRPLSGARVTRRYLAAVDRATGAFKSWNPNDSGLVLKHTASPVSALAIHGRHLYFASATTGQVLRADLVTAEVDENWRFSVTRTGGLPGSIVAMVVHGGVIYLGGDFTTIAGLSIPPTARRALAAVDVDGVLRSWAPFLDGPEGATLDPAAAPARYDHLPRRRLHVGERRTCAWASAPWTAPPASWCSPSSSRWAARASTAWPPTACRSSSPGCRSARRWWARPASLARCWRPTARPAAWCRPAPPSWPDGSTPGASTTPRPGRRPRAPPRGARSSPTAAGCCTCPPAEASSTYAAVPGNPPGPPTLSSTVLGNTVRLSWTASSTGGTPTSYTVFAGSVPGLSNFGGANVGNASSFTTAVGNGTYYVAVVGRNGFGPGPLSNEVTVQVGPPPCTVAPTAPGPLTVTTAATTVALQWGASPTAAGYLLDVGSVPGAADLGSFPLVERDLDCRRRRRIGTYYVRVRAASACGVSLPSNEVAVVVDGSVPLPQAPTGLAATVVGNAVGITWAPPTSGGTPSGYRLEAGYAPGAANAAYQHDRNRFAAAGVPPATYYVRVRAFNAAGLGPASPEITIAVP